MRTLARQRLPLETTEPIAYPTSTLAVIALGPPCNASALSKTLPLALCLELWLQRGLRLTLHFFPCSPAAVQRVQMRVVPTTYQKLLVQHVALSLGQ